MGRKESNQTNRQGRQINPSLVLIQPRKTHPYIAERLLMGHKESNQNLTSKTIIVKSPVL